MTTGQGPAPAGLKTLAASLVPSRITAYSSTAPGGSPGHLAGLAAGAAAAGFAAGLAAVCARTGVAPASDRARAEATARRVKSRILKFPPAGLWRPHDR